MTDRRSFLRILGAGALGAAADALDLERLLWVPGRVSIFDLGDMPRQTGNTLVTDGWTAGSAGVLRKGDIFTIAGLYIPNELGALRRFKVAAVVTDKNGAPRYELEERFSRRASHSLQAREAMTGAIRARQHRT